MINNTVQPGGMQFNPQSMGSLSGTQTSTTAIPGYSTRPFAQIGTALNNYRYRGFPTTPANGTTIGSSSTPSPITPATNPTTPNTQKGLVTTQGSSPSSFGAYKGVNINPGDQADIGRQIAAIDSQQNTPIKGLLSTPNAATYTGTQQTSTPLIPPPTPSGNPYTAPLAATSAAGSATANKYIDQTANYGAGNINIGQRAADIASQYGQQIANVGQKGAQFEAGLNTTGTSPVAQGNAAIAAQTTAAQQQALAQGESAALQGTSQQLLGQSQAASAADNAAGHALTGQGYIQSGMASAATLAQPSATAFGQAVFNPTTGQFENNGGLPGNVMQQYAQMAANGQYAAIPSTITSNPVLSAQLNEAARAINPNYSPIASEAQGTALGSNITSGGTAITSANAQGLNQSIQQETNLNTAVSNAKQLASQLQTALSSTGLDMTNSTDANKAINSLESRLGNSAYTQLNIAVNDARNAYAAILVSTGATPTDAGTAADQNINANMSPKQILAAIDQLNNGLSSRQMAAHQQTQQYLTQLGSSPGGNTGASSHNSGSSSSIANWKFNGQ